MNDLQTICQIGPTLKLRLAQRPAQISLLLLTIYINWASLNSKSSKENLWEKKPKKGAQNKVETLYRGKVGPTGPKSFLKGKNLVTKCNKKKDKTK